MGRIFVKDPKTVKIGAQMLSESAKHDNVNASVFLSDSVLFRNVFDIVSEEESNNFQIQDNSFENKQKFLMIQKIIKKIKLYQNNFV